MFSYLRRIRKMLLEGGKPTKYLIYAGGEVFIIVVGIMIALYLQNWNDDRLQSREFSTLLDQLYTAVTIDHWITQTVEEGILEMIMLSEQFLEDPDSFDKEKFITILNYLDVDIDYLPSDLNYFLTLSRLNPSDVRQNEILKQLTGFVNSEGGNVVESDQEIVSFLKSQDLPTPGLEFSYSGMRIQNYNLVGRSLDSQYRLYTDEEIEKGWSLRNDPTLNKLVRSKLSQLYIHRVWNYNRLETARSLRELIRTYDPETSLLLDNIGIIGSALPKGWNDSEPMQLKDPLQGIWEITITLNEGFVKFRNANSWEDNWGGTQFPEGKLSYYGQNIPVERGVYKVTLNLTEETYQFSRLE